MDELVKKLIEDGILRTPEIIEVFLSVDRKLFVHPQDADNAYGDYPLPIGYGQTISQPTTVAFMLELLQPRPGEKILDVGSGSGWTTALLAQLVGPAGTVYGVEVVPKLVQFGQENLERACLGNATIEQAGDRMGNPWYAPFDRILVSAAATELPQALVDQLRPGGVIVIPIGSAVCRVSKDASSHCTMETFDGFAFVPLRE